MTTYKTRVSTNATSVPGLPVKWRTRTVVSQTGKYANNDNIKSALNRARRRYNNEMRDIKNASGTARMLMYDEESLKSVINAFNTLDLNRIVFAYETYSGPQGMLVHVAIMMYDLVIVGVGVSMVNPSDNTNMYKWNYKLAMDRAIDTYCGYYSRANFRAQTNGIGRNTILESSSRDAPYIKMLEAYYK